MITKNSNKKCRSECPIQDMKSMSDILPCNNQIIMYDTSDGETKVEVLLENETVRLSQKRMAELCENML